MTIRDEMTPGSTHTKQLTRRRPLVQTKCVTCGMVSAKIIQLDKVVVCPWCESREYPTILA